MKLVYGHHKELEDGFCRKIAGLKKADYLKPLLVLTPSARIAHRLEYLLAFELNHFAAMTFDTFLTLSKKILIGNPSVLKNIKPEMSNEGFYGFLSKNILEKIPPDFYGDFKNKGFVNSLRSTVRDIIDARINPREILKNLQSVEFESESEKSAFNWLLKVVALYGETIKRLAFSTRTDLFSRAAELSENSNYLKSFAEVICYGFYDLTGLQLELFDAVRKNCDTTLFFPYMEKRSYKFAEKFFATHILGKAEKIEKLNSSFKNTALGENAPKLLEMQNISIKVNKDNLKVVNVSGAKDEVWYICREILKLKSDGFKFSDIAVVFPSLEMYKNGILNLFGENKIPVNIDIKSDIVNMPVFALCKNLFLLSRNNFDADIIIDILYSPYFKNKNKHRWIEIIKLSRISGGWHQLDMFNDEIFHLSAGLKTSDKRICREIYSWLTKLKGQLKELEESNGWSVLSEKTLSVLKENIDDKALNHNEEQIYRKIIRSVENIKLYDNLRIADKGEFLDELVWELENIEITPLSSCPCGVEILDTISARARTFKVLILAGLNEGLFPQVKREDAFLNDRLRRYLCDNLGYWIRPKLDYFSEQRLVFYSLVTSAMEKLICIYERSDDEGRAKVPSIYLLELMRAADIKKKDQLYVSRHNIKKYLSDNEEFLSDREMSVKISLDGVSSVENYQKAGLGDEYFRALHSKIPQISSFAKAGAYDGFMENYDNFVKKTMSSSSLKDLSECPMRYFFKRIMELGEGKNKLESDILSADKFGIIYHDILLKVYSNMKKSGYWNKKNGSFAAFAESVFKSYLDKIKNYCFGLYPVVWDAKKEVIKENIINFIKDDLMLSENFTPEFFENKISSSIDGLPGKWTGRTDRIDIDIENRLIRVVDYKKKAKGGRNLVSAVLKGETFQPFIYLELAKNLLCGRLENFKLHETIFLALENGKSDNPHKRMQVFSEKDAASKREKIKEIILFLTGLLQKGAFFIRPNTKQFGWCSFCDFKNICRKNNPAVLTRVRHHILFKTREQYGS